MFRFFSWSSAVRSLLNPRCPWGEEWRAAFVVSKGLFLGFAFTDHYRYFQTIKWTKPGPLAPMKRLSIGMLMYSNVVEAAYRLSSLLGASGTPRRDDAGHEAARAKHRRGLVRCVLHIVTFAHISEICRTNDALCGILGVATSLMDLHTAWPKTDAPTAG